MRPPIALLYQRWPLVGTWLIISLIAWYLGSITIMGQGLYAFFTGDIIAFRDTHHSYNLLLPSVLGSLAFAVPLIGLASRLSGNKAAEGLPTMGVRKLDGATAYMLRAVAFRDVIDELFARGFLLGILTIPLGALTSPTVAFYLLFAIGAIPQALELTVVRQGQRQGIRHVPSQLIGVVFLAVTFVQFGLVASVLVHLLYNLILASTERFTAGKRRSAGRTIGASLVLFLVGLYGLVVLNGLAFSHIIQLQFTTLAHFMWASIVLSGLLIFLLEILLYDPEPFKVGLARRVPAGPGIAESIFKGNYHIVTEEIVPTKAQLWWGEAANAVVATIVTCLWVLVANAVTHLWHLSPVYWLAIAAIPAMLCYISASRAVSVNGTARLVWENGPVLLLVISAFPIIGFWGAAFVAVCRELASRLIRRSFRYS